MKTTVYACHGDVSFQDFISNPKSKHASLKIRFTKDSIYYIPIEIQLGECKFESANDLGYFWMKAK